MVAVSERAKKLLLERKREANIDDPATGLRVTPESSGRWILRADRPRSGDQVVEHEGVTVLLVSRDVQGALVGIKMDCMETDGLVELALTQAEAGDGRP